MQWVPALLQAVPSLSDQGVQQNISTAFVGCLVHYVPLARTSRCLRLHIAWRVQHDRYGAFASNLVIEKKRRGCGLGKQVMRSAMEHALQLGAKRLYAEVHSNNEVRCSRVTCMGVLSHPAVVRLFAHKGTQANKMFVCP